MTDQFTVELISLISYEKCYLAEAWKYANLYVRVQVPVPGFLNLNLKSVYTFCILALLKSIQTAYKS